MTQPLDSSGVPKLEITSAPNGAQPPSLEQFTAAAQDPAAMQALLSSNGISPQEVTRPQLALFPRTAVPGPEGITSQEQFEQVAAAVANGVAPSVQQPAALTAQQPVAQPPPQAPHPAPDPQHQLLTQLVSALQGMQAQQMQQQQLIAQLYQPQPERQLTQQERYAQIAQQLKASNLPTNAETIIAYDLREQLSNVMSQWQKERQEMQDWRENLESRAQYVTTQSDVARQVTEGTKAYGDKMTPNARAAITQHAMLLIQAGHPPADAVKAAMTPYTDVLGAPPPTQVVQTQQPAATQPQPSIPPQLTAASLQAMLAASLSGNTAGRASRAAPIDMDRATNMLFQALAPRGRG